MVLASAAGFLGSVWFGVMLGLAGYILGNVVPMSKLTSWFSKS
jgi:hypothetical protein